MTSMKFRIKDEAHSRAIQEKLFSWGYKWCGDGVLFTEMKFLLTNSEGYIMYSSGWEDYPETFDEGIEEEYILLDGELVPASSVELSNGIHASEAFTAEAAHEAFAGVVKSTGGSSSYYQLTITNKAGETIAVETGDILRALVGNDFDLSNIVKACRRAYEASQGRGKQGASIAYDMKKVEYFAQEFAHWHKDVV